jgi:hypothetical protein
MKPISSLINSFSNCNTTTSIIIISDDMPSELPSSFSSFKHSPLLLTNSNGQVPQIALVVRVIIPHHHSNNQQPAPKRIIQQPSTNALNTNCRWLCAVRFHSISIPYKHLFRHPKILIKKISRVEDVGRMMRMISSESVYEIDCNIDNIILSQAYYKIMNRTTLAGDDDDDYFLRNCIWW